MSDIVCLGEAMVEFSQPKAEEGFLMGFGGDTSNCAIAAARAGARAAYVTAIGADMFGDRLMELWTNEGIGTEGVARRDDAPTGVYFITHGAQGHEFTYLRKGSAASRMRPEDLPAEIICKARFLHVSAISQAISETAAETVRTAMTMAKQAGVMICHDSNLRLKLWPLDMARRVIHETMANADIARPSLEDARLLTGLDEADAIADFYLGLGPKIVALTLGSQGALIATAHERRRIPPVSVTSIDATAAGDVFSGFFLAGLTANNDMFTAAAFANAAAALSTTRHGAVSSIPTAAELNAFVELT